MTYTPKHRGEPVVVYRVAMHERERGWGGDDWVNDYDTEEQAREKVREVNAANTATHAPDYYISAQYLGPVTL